MLGIDVCRPTRRDNSLDTVLTGAPAQRAAVPGPPLGRLTIAPNPGSGWVIVDASAC